MSPATDTDTADPVADPAVVVDETKTKQGRQIPIVCPGHTRPLAELSFCHVATSEEDVTLLVSACHDRKPMLRNGSTGDWIGTFAGHKGAVWSCRLDNSGSLAATASGDFSVQVWDAITGASLYQLPHKHIVKTCEFSPNSQFLATGGHEGILRVYDLTKISQNSKAPPLEIPQTSNKIVICKVCWMSDTSILVGCQDGVIRCWIISEHGPPPTEPSFTLNTQDGAEIRDMELKRITNTTTGTGDGDEMLTVAAGDKVYFFSLIKTPTSTANEPIHVYKMPMHFTNEGGASLHPHGTTFIAGGSDLWVRVFDYKTGELLECLKGHHGPIRCLRYSPDGNVYASGSEDGTIRLWKTDPSTTTTSNSDDNEQP